MSDKEVFTELVHKYINGSLTDHEKRSLMQMLDDNGNDPELEQILWESFRQSEDGQFWNEEYRQVFVDRLLKKAFNKDANSAPAKPIHRIHFLRTAWFRYAAAIVIILGSVTYVWNSQNNKNSAAITGSKGLKTDVAPGGEKAVLTLADGSKIILDNAANGNLAQQGNARVVKLANGQIVYNVEGLSEKEVMWNTMSTPAGGQYQVTLPDGTKVWLNAASSITYPVAFMGKERQVKVAGEVYLEVAKNEFKPFLVDIDGKSTVQVLGTSFNINSYADEGSIKTTLVEGSVQVTAQDQTAILQPGQQAMTLIGAPSGTKHDSQAKAENDLVVNSSVDLEQTLAWKNGIFDFTGADLKTVMRQLCRWYDIKVQYKGSMRNMTFEGRMYRNVNLSDVLEALQKMGVKFELEGKNLIVL